MLRPISQAEFLELVQVGPQRLISVLGRWRDSDDFRDFCGFHDSRDFHDFRDFRDFRDLGVFKSAG